MKTALLFLLLAAPAFAQQAAGTSLAACDATEKSVHVSLEPSHPASAQPEPGKATVYFIQDDGTLGDHQHYTLRVAVDGSLAGAYRENSYFAATLEPGEHHICAKVQGLGSPGKLVALAHFTAEPGATYYFRTRFLGGIVGSTQDYVDLNPIDSDEGRYLVERLPLSVEAAH